VNPQGQAATYHFDYGTAAGYGASTGETSAGSGTTGQSQSAAVGRLAPGSTYHFRVVATNGTGDTIGADQTFTTAKLPVLAPRLSGLSLTGKFSAARGGPSISSSTRPPGGILRFTLSRDATITFTIEQPLGGRRVRGRCVTPHRSNRGAKHCTRFITLMPRIALSGRAGHTRARFTGRLGGKALTPGRYLLIGRPTANGQTGPPATVTFTIKP
jgi:hypothetical protein